jgi:uncharacterized membrane protein YgdD (TMEM256/DUF423 family)
MTNSTALRTAALLGFLAVALGAFGAHGLREVLHRNGTAAIWEKAVLYHFIHAIMLFILGGRSPLKLFTWLCFFFGIILFSGSLYVLAFTNTKWFGAITPFGGASFLAGWLCLVICPAPKADAK